MKKVLALAVLLALPSKVLAHCPLCTAGAGAAAAAAALIGVKYGAIGIFMGAFATALGLWIPNKIKKRYFRFQNQILFAFIYLGTLLPMYPFLKGDYTSYYLSIRGDYGSWLNKTYLIDLFVVGSLLGSLVVLISPKISAFVSHKRNKTIKFQGLLITFILLIISALALQFWPR